MQNSLRIRVRRENVPSRLEIRPQLAVIVDFAIEYNLQQTVLIGHRLLAAGQIDNLQTPHTQTDWSVHIKPLVIRSPVL